MLSILGFLAVLAPLVIVHELGHFLFAKLFNVKAEVFSIGFGPRVWSKKIGETEWCVSAIPLGGYVKLLGEEPDAKLSPEDQKRALQRQEPWKRFFIFAGGPLFNFIWAVIVFMAILLIGEPQMASVVGRVIENSPAEKVGFQSGDEIVSIDGQPVKRFEEVINLVSEKPSQEITVKVNRANLSGEKNQLDIKVTPSPEDGYSIYGEETSVGMIDGLFPTSRAATVGVSNPKSPAGIAGFKTGDEIKSVNDREVKNWEELMKLYASFAPGTELKINATRKDANAPIVATFKKPAQSKGLGADFGLHSSELFVDKTVEKAPAEAAGLRAGDRLVAVGSKDVITFFELKDAVQKAGEKDGKVEVRWERDGQIQNAVITPTSTNTRDAVLKKSTQFTIGIIPLLNWAEPITIVERIYNPFKLVYKATERMVVFSWRNLVSMKKMITGDVSVAALGGPILIGKIAGESLARGFIAFLTTMGILSVGLGVLNILPVPVLDGGHLLLLGIEAIRGKPLSIRQMEIIQQVGLSLILLLMVVVMRNDLARLPIFN